VIKNVRDLSVYQLAHKLAMEIFEITKKFPKEETYSLGIQMILWGHPKKQEYGWIFQEIADI
jgi:hypothetical protein